MAARLEAARIVVNRAAVIIGHLELMFGLGFVGISTRKRHAARSPGRRLPATGCTVAARIRNARLCGGPAGARGGRLSQAHAAAGAASQRARRLAPALTPSSPAPGSPS